MADSIVKTLSSIERFSIAGDVKGRIDAPSIALRSDLDKQLKNIVGAKLGEGQAELEAKLRARLDSELELAAGPYKNQVAALTQTEKSLDERLSQLEEILKAEMKNALDDQKSEAKEKIKGRLKDLKF